jgi:hypothetical protein
MKSMLNDFTPAAPRLPIGKINALLLFLILISALCEFVRAEPAGAATTAAPSSPADESGAAQKKRRHQLGIDLGFDTDPDILAPVAPVGVDRHFEWDYRLNVRDDRVGLNAQYRDPARLQKLSFSFRQRMDVPTRLGLGRTRNDVYKSLSQKTRARDVTGYIVGSALVINHYWGLNLSHDEYVKSSAGEHFHRQLTTLGFGYSPLGENHGRAWGYSIDPSVSFEKFHGFAPDPPSRTESFGYSLGPTFYYGFNEIRVGPRRMIKLDRLKTGIAVSDSEADDLAFTAGVNVTAYATRFLKLSIGLQDSYGPHDGKHAAAFTGGVSLRVTWSDFQF